MSKNSGFMCNIKGGGKAIVYHREQEPEFKKAGKHFIHYFDDNMQPVMVDGKPKSGLKASDQLNICGYLD